MLVIQLLLEQLKSKSLSQEAVNELMKQLGNALLEATKRSVPFSRKKIPNKGKKNRKRKDKPWFNQDCKDLHQIVRKLATSIQRTGPG